MDFIWNNAGWLITIVGGAFSFFVYAVRQNDKITAMDRLLNDLNSKVETMSRDFQQLSYSVNTQQETINKMETAIDRVNESVNKLNTHIEVIATWVKIQSGDTVIKRKGN